MSAAWPSEDGARPHRPPCPIDAEVSIVWLEDPSKYDYLRETVTISPWRARRPTWCGRAGRLIAFAQLRAGAGDPSRSGVVERRCWWIAEHDRSEQPDGVYKHGAPCEAVDPRTIRAREWSSWGPRAWGGPLHREAAA